MPADLGNVEAPEVQGELEWKPGKPPDLRRNITFSAKTNLEGFNNFLKVIELVRGKLVFESWCIRSMESLRVNFTETLVEGDNLFRTAAFTHGRGLWHYGSTCTI